MRVTLYVMVAIGAAFWFAAIVLPQLGWPFIFFSSLLVAWCVFELMTIEEEE